MITFLLAFFTMAIQSINSTSRCFVVGIFVAIFVSAVGHLTAEHVVRFTRGKIYPWVFAHNIKEGLPI
jgi:hypothetical protein